MTITNCEGHRFLHECPEWDGMLISEEDHEFAACRCGFGRTALDEEAEAIRDSHREDR